MDIITHIALGACMGEAMLGKKIGKKAMLWGALAHSFPDIDVVSALWLDTPAGLLAHRGITHSITGAIITTILFSWIAMKIDDRKVKPTRWITFFLIVVLLHPLIDAFNSYGVGWFEPFNNYRVSFNTIYVADPIFSAAPVFAAIALVFIHPKSMLRKVWWRVAFLVTGIYLVTCVTNKAVVDHQVKRALKQQEISYNRYFTTPAPFQNLLWYVVAANDSGFYVGYRSVFDRSDKIAFHFHSAGKYLLANYTSQRELDLLTRFSQQWYTIEQWHDTLVFNDLRFGQIAGWYDTSAHFSFHYYLGDSLDNKLVMQRGRIKGWTNPAINSFFRRIAGN